jgi:hypothetical protein
MLLRLPPLLLLVLVLLLAIMQSQILIQLPPPPPPTSPFNQGIDGKTPQWYDLDDKKPWKVETLQLMAAMGVPGGGRNSLPVRLVRLLTTAETRDTYYYYA